MPNLTSTALPVAIIALLWTPVSFGADFNDFASAPAELVAPVVDRPDLIFEAGLGGGVAPVYQGSKDFGGTFNPIFKLERLNIPGIIDIGGNQSAGGFTFAPSIAVQGARKASDHPELTGLTDLGMTFELGGKAGYEFDFTDALSAEFYGELRYAVGGAKGFTGGVGLDLTDKLTSQFELVGGVSADFADKDYMGTFFGVTAAESLASGGKFAAYDPAGGVKSVNAKLAAKYEFVPDTFLNASVEYRRLVGSAADSPIVKNGSDNQFLFGVGVSRRFSINY